MLLVKPIARDTIMSQSASFKESKYLNLPEPPVIFRSKSVMSNQTALTLSNTGGQGHSAYYNHEDYDRLDTIEDLPGETDAVTESQHDGTPDMNKKFEEYLELNGPMTVADEERYRSKSDQEKQVMIRDQVKNVGKTSMYSVVHYVEELQRFTIVQKKGRKKRKDAFPSLAELLKKLKIDLYYAVMSFVNDFVRHGEAFTLLLNVLNFESPAKTDTKSKAQQSIETEKFDALVCVKFIVMRNQESVKALVSHPTALQSLVAQWYQDNVQLITISVQLLAQCCDISGSYDIINDAMYEAKRQHKQHCVQQLMKTMNEIRVKRPDDGLQVACLAFFSAYWRAAGDVIKRALWQSQLESCGLDVDAIDQDCPGHKYEAVHEELNSWRLNHVDLQSSGQMSYELEMRNKTLRQEINRLQIDLKAMEREVKEIRSSEEKLAEECTRYRDKASELQQLVDRVMVQYHDRTGEDLDPSLNLAVASLDRYATIGINKGGGGAHITHKPSLRRVIDNLPIHRASTFSEDPIEDYDDTADFTAAIPQTPVLSPVSKVPNFKSNTVRLKVTTRHPDLPGFNWTPLDTVEGTMFETVDSEIKLREIDFSDLEEKFRVHTKPMSEATKVKRERILSKPTTEIITFMSMAKSRNLLIVKKRLGLSDRNICHAINTCDTKVVPGEVADVLRSNFIPTKLELKQLDEHAHHVELCGEAEQTLFHLSRVDRLESKLAAMGFMDQCMDTCNILQPFIALLKDNSLKVLSSSRFRQVLEIVLAFGNYMNSAKKPFAVGFKLDSLTKLKDVRSADKSLTLLDYLENYIYHNYPEIHGFTEDLDLQLDKSASYTAALQDLSLLRKGLDVVKYEMEKQPHNRDLKDFYGATFHNVSAVADDFRRMEEVYKRLCAMLGENYKTAETDLLFQPIVNFCNDFKAAQARGPRTSVTPLHSPKQPFSDSGHYSNTNGVLNSSTSSSGTDNKSGYKSANGNADRQGPKPANSHADQNVGYKSANNGAAAKPRFEMRSANHEVNIYDDTQDVYDDVDVTRRHKNPSIQDRIRRFSVKPTPSSIQDQDVYAHIPHVWNFKQQQDEGRRLAQTSTTDADWRSNMNKIKEEDEAPALPERTPGMYQNMGRLPRVHLDTNTAWIGSHASDRNRFTHQVSNVLGELNQVLTNQESVEFDFETSSQL